jgi:NADH/F420H2 dehydrogenase subunit C
MKILPLKNLVEVLPLICSSNINKETTVVLNNENLHFSLFCLKKHINFQYKILTCISGVDFISSNYRFGVVYELLSLSYSSRIRLKIFINEITSVESSISVYTNADWWEREVWDLFGIYFNKHPDLRRILTDYGFEGYPMRKDFPLSGYVELKYDRNKKRIVLNSVELSQEFRFFSFETPW